LGKDSSGLIGRNFAKNELHKLGQVKVRRPLSHLDFYVERDLVSLDEVAACYRRPKERITVENVNDMLSVKLFAFYDGKFLPRNGIQVADRCVVLIVEDYLLERQRMQLEFAVQLQMMALKIPGQGLSDNSDTIRQ
jgi:hypothetical protein